MPRTASKLAELDEAAGRIDSFSVDTAFGLPDGGRLVVKVESPWSASGLITFELGVAVADGRRSRATDVWKTRSKKLSTAIQAFAKQFPGVTLPPTHFHLSCRGAALPSATLQRLVLEGLAEAFGKSLPAAGTAAKQPKGDPQAWVAALRGGPDGLRRWNRLKAADRKAVELSGADLSGLDLTEATFRGVKAKTATFAGATLARAEMSEGCFDRSDFSKADLQDAHLKGVSALEADFRGAKLARAVLSHGMFLGASFAGADLTGADLTDTNIQKADLTGATLDGAALDAAFFDARTRWPAGFVIPAEVLFGGPGTDPRLSGKGKNAVATNINGLMARLNATIDPKRMKRTLDMLKSGKNQLFAEVEPDHVRGIVRSQREEDLVYSCVLTENGTYACCTPDLSPCMGLRGEPCKHILVLLIGLARAGEIDPTTVDRWVVAAAGKNHKWNKTTRNHVSDTLLRYKGVQAGEVDWRPTETIPEDFYTM
jgi:uncharacterized protein YjbI with pentapeptide repeats